MANRSEWHGHRLAVLPPGESWLAGAPRRPTASEEDRGDRFPIDRPIDRPIDVADRPTARLATAPRTSRPSESMTAQAVSAAGSRRGGALLAVLGLSALITIIVGRHSGPVADPPPLPEQPSHVITALSRTQETTLRVHVGEYIKFALPAGLTYSTVIEQPTTASPAVEALALPGQQPQLRADTTGHAFVEVLAEPTCPATSSCPDLRKVAGGLDVTVLP